jgi:two-component system sensor histidine kinase BaeS
MQTPLEIAFLKQQYVMFYFVGGGILLITAMVSFLLARHLLSPIKQLTEGTQALTSRNFGTRIIVRSQDELGQLAADFNFMAQTLGKNEEMRQQWMTDIAHELRTPLAVLQGEIEAMLDGVREVSRGRLESLHAEIIHLGNIVNDLHELSLAETQALPFRKEPVNPVDVLKEVLNSFETRLAQRQIRVIDDLGADREITLLGDADRLNQLFVNLLENCVKYCDSPGTLKIWQKREDEVWRLYFEDSGPGVPEASVDHLFDRLYRVDKSRSRAMGGSGLGLSICKSIVETLGGDIYARNAPSGGLRIEMIFPLI